MGRIQGHTCRVECGGDYYSDVADVIKRKDHIVNAMKDWSAWISGSGVGAQRLNYCGHGTRFERL